MRKPLQGLRNVIRFNWPYYVVATILVVFLALPASRSDGWIRITAIFLASVIALATLASLFVTLYVYDLSGFYGLKWLGEFPIHDHKTIISVNAGFDETSALLKSKYPNADIVACDFFDVVRHTESSIARARREYPMFEQTISVSTEDLPFQTGSIELMFAIMSAHEIREADERNAFFAELSRLLAPHGRLIVVEHLRNVANIVAYNLGAFHFHSRSVWLNCFRYNGLSIEREKKLTPFVTAFFLKKHGTGN